MRLSTRPNSTRGGRKLSITGLLYWAGHWPRGNPELCPSFEVLAPRSGELQTGRR